jgi:hypothetical protein
LHRRFRAWNTCNECGFEGLVVFSCRDEEDYDDDDALGVMLDAVCPACEGTEAVLVTIEYFREMQAFEQRRGESPDRGEG